MRVKASLLILAFFGVLCASATFAKEIPVQSSELIGVEWRVTQILYQNGEMREALPNTRVSAVFDKDGTMTGSAGCNRYSAAFSVSGNSIRVGGAATTRMHCPWPKGIMEQESAFLHRLKYVSRFHLDGEQLELMDPLAQVTLILVDANSDIFNQNITGTWYIESLGGKKLLPGTRITMVFTEDGRVTGKATINNYFASWIESDGLILFSNAGSTMMAGPERHMHQESEFLRMLGKVRKYKIREGQLILTTAEGEQITAARAKAE